MNQGLRFIDLSLLKTGRSTAQWAASSESLTVSFQSENVGQHIFSSNVKSLEILQKLEKSLFHVQIGVRNIFWRRAREMFI